MGVLIVLEAHEGQHDDLQPPSGRLVPYCRCGGPAIKGQESCFRCGRYKRELFRVEPVNHHAANWGRLMRERPAA